MISLERLIESPNGVHGYVIVEHPDGYRLFCNGCIIARTELPIIDRWGWESEPPMGERVPMKWDSGDADQPAAVGSLHGRLRADAGYWIRRVGDRIVNEKYFRLFPATARWMQHADPMRPFTVWDGDMRIGLVMPMRQESVDGLPEIRTEDIPDWLLYAPAEDDDD